MTDLTITFTSDWHVGTGAGIPGAVDRVVRTDESGLPIVPARTVTGLWRDGCERAAGALGGGWLAWIDVLFGRSTDRGRPGRAPRGAALSVRTATLAPALAAALRADGGARRALFGVRPGVAMDAGTGQAVPRTLRMIEVVRPGLTVTAPVDLDDSTWDGEQRRTAGILLALGVEQVGSLGGTRRRGLGRCTWSTPVADDVRAALAAPIPPVAAPAPTPPDRAPALAVRAEASAGWTTIELVATLVDSVVSTDQATDVLVRGLPFVPGGRLLPAVVAAARRAGIEVEHLIITDGLRCGPLVPELGGDAAVPLPATFGRESGAELVYNRLADTAPPGVVPKPLRGKWIGPGPVITGGRTRIQMHNVVDDDKERPTSEVGGLYGYESIPQGSTLRGTLRVRLDTDAGRLAAALTGRWRVGLAAKDEYGRVDVKATVGSEPPPNPVPDPATITVWFATDAVLLDERLAPVGTLPGVLATLGEAIGAPVELESPAAQAVSFGRADGWHARWVRPRPTLPTVRAGSVLWLRRVDLAPIERDVRARLAADGVGARRAEGYGRLVIDAPVLANATLEPVADGALTTSPAPPALSEAEKGLLQELRHAHRRATIEAKAAALDRRAWPKLRDVSTSQLAALRLALSVLPPEAAIAGMPNEVRAAADLEGLVEKVWDLIDVPVADRADDLRGFALGRVLAHLLAGGAVAPVGGTS